MWHRNEARPVMYNGITFRSALEAKVAEELDGLDVLWEYERRTPFTERYLPDFTITEAHPDLELPRWVEVKPAELLYAVRDYLDVPERFDADQWRWVIARGLHEAQLTEIPKPKRLAEVSGEPVLVVSAINRNRTLSLWLNQDGIRFSKRHPAVNHKQVLLDRAREAEHEAWRLRYEEQARQRAEQATARRANNLAWAQAVTSRPARFEGVCIVCFELHPATNLRIANHSGRWLAFCSKHLLEGAR